MQDYLPLIVQLIAGALGGNLVGGLVRRNSLGPLWNAVIGVLGAYGESRLGLLDFLDFGDMGTLGDMEIGALVEEVASGAAGGGVLIAVAGIVKRLLTRGER